MARAKTNIPITDVIIKTETIDQDRAAANALVAITSEHDAQVRALAAEIGYLLPDEGGASADLIQRDIAINMRRSVQVCLEIGKGLIVLKKVCGHGNFGPRLEALGMDVNVAGKFMSTARRMSNSFSKMNLIKAIDSQTKLFEMLVLDDEQLEELALTGQTGELKLDDVAGMSVKELRANLRKATAKVDANERTLEQKNKKIDELTSWKPSKDSIARTEHEALQIKGLNTAIDGATVEFQKLNALILEMMVDGQPDHITERARGGVRYVLAHLRRTIGDSGLGDLLDLDPYAEDLLGRPSWMGGTSAQG